MMALVPKPSAVASTMSGAPHPFARAVAVGNDPLQLGPIHRVEVKADIVTSHVDPPLRLTSVSMTDLRNVGNPLSAPEH